MSFGQIALGFLLLLFLLGFLVVGVVCILNPRWGMRHFNRTQFRAGGKTRQDWNELGFQLMGAVFAALALYMLFHLVHR